MSQKIVLKRGDTLLLTCTHLQGNTPVNLGGWTLASAVRGLSGALVWRFAPRVWRATNARPRWIGWMPFRATHPARS